MKGPRKRDRGGFPAVLVALSMHGDAWKVGVHRRELASAWGAMLAATTAREAGGKSYVERRAEMQGRRGPEEMHRREHSSIDSR